jgi:hypothetical protein
MLWINGIYFLNIDGKLNKTIIIGDKLYLPKPDTKRLYSVDSKVYFTGCCGTNDYVYCLYRGAKPQDSVDVRIFVFNWEGEHITTIKTDGNIWKIAADKNNKYLFGLLGKGVGWSSTDIVKIPLEGVLKK